MFLLRKRQPPTPERLARSYLFASIFMLGLATFFWQDDARLLDAAKASVKWPTTQAIIADSHIEESTQSSKSGSYQVYQCIVSYDYKVNGKSYTANRISFATRANEPERDRSIAEHALHEFPAGNEVQVHYNGANPSEAVLVPGVNPEGTQFKSLMFFVVGFYTLIFSAVIWFARGFLQPGPGFNLRMMAINLPCLFIVLGVLFNKPAIIKMMVPPSAVIAGE